MLTTEGVIAEAEIENGVARIVIFPIANDPARRVAPEAALVVTFEREPWQSADAHERHVAHMIGRAALVDHHQGRIASVRST